MSFTRWVRNNAEHYLLAAAQARVAESYGLNPPRQPRGPVQLFWLRIFAPAYRILPWGLRRKVLATMPGSHRKAWAWEQKPHGPAV